MMPKRQRTHERSMMLLNMSQQKMRSNVAALLRFLLVSLLALKTTLVEAEEGRDPLAVVRSKYESLSPKGKFAAGCTLGFVGSRIAVKTAVNCLKVGAAAFITAEALHFTGIMEDIPDFSNEQIAIFANAKNAVLRETDKYRVGIRKTLSRDSIQNFFDNEKPAAFGLVSGALVATFL